MDEKEKVLDDELVVIAGPEAGDLAFGDVFRPKSIPVKTLAENIKAFTNKIEGILTEVESVGTYKLTEIVVGVNITAGGEIQLIGVAKGKGEVGGGISLKFSKNR